MTILPLFGTNMGLNLLKRRARRRRVGRKRSDLCIIDLNLDVKIYAQ